MSKIPIKGVLYTRQELVYKKDSGRLLAHKPVKVLLLRIEQKPEYNSETLKLESLTTFVFRRRLDMSHRKLYYCREVDWPLFITEDHKHNKPSTIIYKPYGTETT